MGGGAVWNGNMRNVVINKLKAFDGNPDDPIEGGETVGFQKIELNENGTATLNFAPDKSTTTKESATEKSISEDELKQFSIFLSNFAEQGIFSLETDFSTDDWILFGIRHNYINNRKIVDRCKVKNCPYGAFVIKAEHVFESMKEYVDWDLAVRDFKEGSVSYRYSEKDGFYLDLDTMLYHFDPERDGTPVYYAKATSAMPSGRPLASTTSDGVRHEWNGMIVKGYYYNEDDEDERNGTFTATIVMDERNGYGPLWIWSLEHNK